MHTINENHMIYGSWDKEHDRPNFFVILGHFLPFYSTNNPKNQNLEKIKQTPGDIIILHKHIRHHNHILYCSLDMARDSYVIFIFHLLPLKWHIEVGAHLKNVCDGALWINWLGGPFFKTHSRNDTFPKVKDPINMQGKRKIFSNMVI